MYLNTVFKYNVFKYCPALDTSYMCFIQYSPGMIKYAMKLKNFSKWIRKAYL